MPVGLKIPGSLGEGIFALPAHEFMEGSGWSESGTWNIGSGWSESGTWNIDNMLCLPFAETWI